MLINFFNNHIDICTTYKFDRYESLVDDFIYNRNSPINMTQTSITFM